MSFYEIYNEKLYDLLNEGATRSEIEQQQKTQSSSFGKATRFNKSKAQKKPLRFPRSRKQPLKIREIEDNEIFIENLNNVECRGWKHCLEILERGEHRRTSAETRLNRESSRSHAVLELKISIKNFQGKGSSSIRPSVILVDLAGNESLGKVAHESKAKIAETSNINKSLLALTRVIKKLNKVPYFQICLL